MRSKKTDFFIINRSFGARANVIGHALLQFANSVALYREVWIIGQASQQQQKTTSQNKIAGDVKICVCSGFSGSKNSVVMRLLETFQFLLWVFVNLLVKRPSKVYVTSDPPIFVPFIVFIYSKIFRAQYYYHLQDIHPEIINIVFPLNRFVFLLLRFMDNLTLRNATAIFTLSEDMRAFARKRSGTKAAFHLLVNPALSVTQIDATQRNGDVVFCGNLGRLQHVPLLISSIKKYLNKNGKLRFTFIGDGVFAAEVSNLAQTYENVLYLGFLPAKQAVKAVSNHRWALLPIQDDVTQFAFPSKSSTYIMAGCRVIAICGDKTSVGRWVKERKVGFNCQPTEKKLVEAFKFVEEAGNVVSSANKRHCEELKIPLFVDELIRFCEVGR